MKRIRPLMVLLVSLALACMGSTLAFADSESSARAAQSEPLPMATRHQRGAIGA